MRVLWITALVLLIDQSTKAIVLHTMRLGQSIPLIGDWMRFTFTENPGMAFGITLGSPMLVTVFSMIATLLIILYFFKISEGYLPYRASLAFVLGGALGNIIDRVFYGTLVYDTPLFTGRVVDFIHIKAGLLRIPDFIPGIGGAAYPLFPIWNVADMAIVCGVVGILIFQHRFHEQMMAAHYGTADADPDSTAANGELEPGTSLQMGMPGVVVYDDEPSADPTRTAPSDVASPEASSIKVDAEVQETPPHVDFPSPDAPERDVTN